MKGCRAIATNPRSLRRPVITFVPHFKTARLRSLPATTSPADAATTATLRLHCTTALRHGYHFEPHHRRFTPSARLRRKSDSHDLGNCTSPANRSIAFADRATDVPLPPMECLFVLAPTTDIRSVPPTFRHGVTDCYVWLQFEVSLRSPIHCATFRRRVRFQSVCSQAHCLPSSAHCSVTTPLVFRAEFQHSTISSKLYATRDP